MGLAAAVVANLTLATGPWLVRLAETGPVATGFWRLALAIPALLVWSMIANPGALRRGIRFWPVLLVAGLALPPTLRRGTSASCARRSPTRRCSPTRRR